MDRFVTRPFVTLSLAIGLFAGFVLGGAAFAATALGVPVGPVWAAFAQAHGHAQLFGFAGLMVFGVALVFLPRLRGAPLGWGRFVPWVLALYGGGVVLRVTAQAAGPLIAAGAGQLLFGLSAVIAASGVLTLLGAALGIAMLVRTGVVGPPIGQRAGLAQVLPLLVTAWLGLLGALAVNAWGSYETLAGWRVPASGVPPVRPAPWLVPPETDARVVRLAFVGWLVPMSVAFAARNFPLFLWTHPAPGRWLRWGLALLLAGLAADLGGPLVRGAGEMGVALEGASLLWLTAVVGALGSKVQPPGRQRDPAERQLAEITRAPLTEAFVWLAVAGALLIAQAVLPGAGITPPPEDAARHALGAGFVLLLIVGMALRLIPGFAGGRRPVNLRAARLASWAAQAAALLRVAPTLAVWLLATFDVEIGPGPLVPELLSLAGVAGAVSVGALWWALRPALERSAERA